MAVNLPPSPMAKQDLRTPHLPPVLNTRSGNELYDRPHTPTHHGFTTPVHTPQGSPSKSRVPPGAVDLPHVFDNALRLTPSPTKTSSMSPKGHHSHMSDDTSLLEESVLHKTSDVPETRSANKENAAPGVRLGKTPAVNPSPAATSRNEPYLRRERETRRQTHNRGLTPEELEKLQLPNVKRLANVTQLCKLSSPFCCYHVLTV